MEGADMFVERERMARANEKAAAWHETARTVSSESPVAEARCVRGGKQLQLHQSINGQCHLPIDVGAHR